MRKMWEKQIVRNLVFAILVGAFYSLLSFLDKGYIEAGGAVSTTAAYFLISCLMSAVAPKLRKLTGHEEASQ